MRFGTKTKFGVLVALSLSLPSEGLRRCSAEETQSGQPMDVSLCEVLGRLDSEGVLGGFRYTVKQGDSLYSIAERYELTAWLIRCLNSVIGSRGLIYAQEDIKLIRGPIDVTVDIESNMLGLWWDDIHIKSYPVSTGRGSTHETPKGEFRVSLKLWDPFDFENSAAPGHPDNQFGNLWLSLDVKGYGIHGTNDPQGIGQNSTDGCIRLRNEHAREVGDAIVVGSRVVIE